MIPIADYTHKEVRPVKAYVLVKVAGALDCSVQGIVEIIELKEAP